MGTINASQIIDLPKSATHVSLSLDKCFNELFYRVKSVKYNDGTYKDEIQYLSSFGVWMGSSLENTDTLTKIIF